MIAVAPVEIRAFVKNYEYPGRLAEPDGSHIKGVGITYRQKCLRLFLRLFFLPRIAYYGVKNRRISYEYRKHQYGAGAFWSILVFCVLI